MANSEGISCDGELPHRIHEVRVRTTNRGLTFGTPGDERARPLQQRSDKHQRAKVSGFGPGPRVVREEHRGHQCHERHVERDEARTSDRARHIRQNHQHWDCPPGTSDSGGQKRNHGRGDRHRGQGDGEEPSRDDWINQAHVEGADGDRGRCRKLPDCRSHRDDDPDEESASNR